MMSSACKRVLFDTNLFKFKADAVCGPAILATQEAKAGESEVQDQLCSSYRVMLSQER